MMNIMKKGNNISRRTFLKSSAFAGALGAIGTGSATSILTSCSGGESGSANSANKPLKEPGSYYIPELPDKAADGKELRAGVIGCGGRGSGAAWNFLNAAIFLKKIFNLNILIKSILNQGCFSWVS